MPIIEGLSGGLLLEVTEKKLADEIVAVSDEDAIAMTHRLAEEEGLFCGVLGANVHVALQVAKNSAKASG